MTEIHPTAIVEDGARLGSGVRIGPFCVVSAGAEIGDRTVLQSHVVISGHTRIGSDCQIFPFASLGSAPQDLKYRGEKNQLVIGDRNVIREYVTMNAGTKPDQRLTQVGSDSMFMTAAHIAHDCVVGNGVVFANAATLGGFVTVGDNVIIGGLAAVHQFVRVGRNAIIGGVSAASAQELLCPQKVVAKTCPIGAPENRCIPTIPTAIRENATQTPVPSRANRTKSRKEANRTSDITCLPANQANSPAGLHRMVPCPE